MQPLLSHMREAFTTRPQLATACAAIVSAFIGLALILKDAAKIAGAW